MTRITFIESTGQAHEVEAPVGWSLMKAAVQNSVPGILAECGGACVCATCHVYIEESWAGKLPSMSGPEKDTIEFAHAMRPNSRLSCQVVVQPEFEGLRVHLPESQLA